MSDLYLSGSHFMAKMCIFLELINSISGFCDLKAHFLFLPPSFLHSLSPSHLRFLPAIVSCMTASLGQSNLLDVHVSPAHSSSYAASSNLEMSSDLHFQLCIVVHLKTCSFCCDWQCVIKTD